MQKLFYILSVSIILSINAEPDLNLSLPELGDRVSGVVSNDQEKIIGNEFLKQVYSQAPLISDPLIQEYSELLVYRLSEYSQVKDRNFNVLLIDDNSLNAFAAPGGVIGINGGLFLNAQNEGQFASVITHELAHLSQRHFARNILNSQDNNIASILVMVSAVAAAVATNNPTAFMAGPAFLQQQSLRYSRLFEREADRVGFNNLINAEYDPSSMGEMFEQMAKLRRLAGDKIPEFLLTHPISSSRVTDAFNAADQVETPFNTKNSLNYEFIRGRLQIRYEDIPLNSVRKMKGLLEKDPYSNENRYALSLAYKISGQHKEALKIINSLIIENPKNLILVNTKAEILLDEGKSEDALEVVNIFLNISPKNYPLSVLKAKILAYDKKLFAAEELIRDQLLRRNNDPYLWLYLSEVQRDSKNVIGYHQSRAEYYLLLGQYEDALNQLQFALKLTESNFQVSESIMTKINSTRKSIKGLRGQ
ncbi:MAG: M48 family metalloprotease [SAR86 cluster bacterium]|jgi:predicted Zn-dependent protease|nr:M48 family metalloprotease [SAR86 cluster bacterium]|tara:strand:+ start:927 stop:2357 length:1431 start_codon:yes stop_codon:yes gene_type:complete